MIRSSLRLTLLLALAMLPIIGCGDDAPVDPARTVNWTRPNAGSVFTYAAYATDSTGAKIAGSDETYTDSVIAHGVTASGVTGLVRMTYFGISQALVDYRANGDLALALELEAGIASPWSVFPIGSRGTTTQEPWSRTFGDSSAGVTWSSPYTTIIYQGTEQLSIAAGSFATHKILVRQFDTTDAGDPYITNRTIWFAPSIGTYVRQSLPAEMVNSNKGSFTELRSYSLK
jgi:hypothetical protein